jgi:hypothetical protein
MSLPFIRKIECLIQLFPPGNSGVILLRETQGWAEIIDNRKR